MQRDPGVRLPGERREAQRRAAERDGLTLPAAVRQSFTA
jgi:LDH2 family malate/lactate/ureidoglycolate dehydrogenase